MNIIQGKGNRINEYDYDGKTYYCVETYDGQGKAIFDHDERVLNALVAELSTGQCGLYVRNGNKLGFRRWNKKSGETLASFLYGVYYPEKEQQGEIRHIYDSAIDETVEDCRSCNLYRTGEVVPETKNRKVEILSIGVQQYIRVLIKAQNAECFFDYSDGLYKLLATPSAITFDVNKDKRGVARMYKNKRRITVFLSHLAYYWYQGLIDENDYYGSVGRAKKRFKGMTIDHLNSDIRNNCSYNLSVMSESVNKAKYNFSNIVQPPSFIYGVVYNGAYYLKVGNAGRFVSYIHCVDEDTLLNCLQIVTGRTDTMFRSLCLLYVSDKGLVSAPTTFCSGSSSVGRNFETDCLQAQELLSRPIQTFGKWVILRKTAGNIYALMNDLSVLLGYKY